MIARIWHGKTRAAKADEYMEFLERTGIPDYRNTQGNQGVYVLRNFVGDEANFVLISLWETEGDIQRFAGSDIQIARYYPGDEKFLLEMEPGVEHYEVLVSP